ncbi:murein biosynthesis integral membrane protein MurJ [Radiobacillus deserti]|uniref:Probable lipid II flippase MurJ n=1 Tax=Radiobacillus deserti TaxID=2594883 RepID=A0A516KJA4_9BACI|nr:murein biosynthesis integral membrane protein MurJ [Radiobacillus deserti]QDP41477.1 murein biosynthesis integral membrane protein MurJ [Radiobacillus deserti]
MRLLKILGAVAVINVLARLLGFAREVIIGYQYGTSFEADSIITAFTIPNFFYIVLGGAVTTAFISVYSKLDESRKKQFVQTIFTWLTITVGVLTLLFMVFSDLWIQTFFSGMSSAAMELTSNLFIWMAPSTFFLVIGMWLSGVMNVYGSFRLTAFSTLAFNAVFVLLGVVLTPSISVYSYGLGATIGAVVMVLVLVRSIRREQLVSFRFVFEKSPDTKRFLKLAIPILFGGATLQFYFLIQRIFAADLDQGAIASLNYASKMTQFPQAVLMTSVTTVIYPMLAKAAGAADFKKMEDIYQKGFRWLTVLLVPATVFVYFFAEEIIQAVFEYGNFNSDSTRYTFPLLQILSLSMLTLALNTYVTRFFYAMENSYLPIIYNVISIFVINIIVVQVFIDEYGASAIAMGTVIGTAVNLVLLMMDARRKYKYQLSDRKTLAILFAYLVGTSVVIWASSLLPIESVYLYLIPGGLITAGSVLGGLRLFR